MKICNLCGFIPATRSTVGSMKLHALRKHNEPEYLKLFTETTEEKTVLDPGTVPKKKAVKLVKEKRFLNPSDPAEAAAMAAGYRYIIENGPDPDNWDLVK